MHKILQISLFFFFQKKHILMNHLHALEKKGMSSRFLTPPP